MLLMGLLCCALTSCEKENHLFNEDQDGLISSQQRYITLTLSDVINYYSLSSPMAKIEYLNFQNEILEFANYKKGLLPAISFNVNPVNFNRSLRLLQSRKHSKKCTFYTLRFGCSFAAVNTIKPQLL